MSSVCGESRGAPCPLCAVDTARGCNKKGPVYFRAVVDTAIKKNLISINLFAVFRGVALCTLCHKVRVVCTVHCENKRQYKKYRSHSVKFAVRGSCCASAVTFFDGFVHLWGWYDVRENKK